MINKTLRALVVDDTVIYRKVVRGILEEIEHVEVIATAPNGKIALEKIERLQPDFITLDLEMPVLDGIGVLEHLHATNNPTQTLILSSLSCNDAKKTMSLLKLGAFDFVLKPSGSNITDNFEEFQRKLCSKIMAIVRYHEKHSERLSNTTNSPVSGDSSELSISQIPTQSKFCKPYTRPEVVVIGISTGGPQALIEMLPKLPADFPLPVLIVQHMPPIFTKSLADDLDEKCMLHVQEAEDGQLIMSGNIYLAPGGKQMKVDKQDENHTICITDDPPENSCRPSVDYLFRSIASSYGSHSLGLIMTGMGRDGTDGCILMKQQGARIIAQDEESCVVFGMPRELIEKGLADLVVPLDQIAASIVQEIEQGITT